MRSVVARERVVRARSSSDLPNRLRWLRIAGRQYGCLCAHARATRADRAARADHYTTGETESGLARAITGRTEMSSSEANQKSAVTADAAGMSEVLPSLPPLPPTFPPGVDPATYQLETVSRLLKRAAYFSIFSIHNPNVPNIPIPSPRDPGSLIGIEANEELHRFETTVEEPASECGLNATNRVEEPV